MKFEGHSIGCGYSAITSVISWQALVAWYKRQQQRDENPSQQQQQQQQHPSQPGNPRRRPRGTTLHSQQPPLQNPSEALAPQPRVSTAPVLDQAAENPQQRDRNPTTSSENPADAEGVPNTADAINGDGQDTSFSPLVAVIPGIEGLHRQDLQDLIKLLSEVGYYGGLSGFEHPCLTPQLLVSAYFSAFITFALASSACITAALPVGTLGCMRHCRPAVRTLS